MGKEGSEAPGLLPNAPGEVARAETKRAPFRAGGRPGGVAPAEGPFLSLHCSPAVAAVGGSKAASEMEVCQVRLC